MPRSNYATTIITTITRLQSLGADVAAVKDQRGWIMTSKDESRAITSMPMTGKEFTIFLAGYSRGREAEALAQMATGEGTEIIDGTH